MSSMHQLIPQELMQILPCEQWGVYGFPTSPKVGWVGNPQTWELDVGGLGSNVFFSGVNPQKDKKLRSWISFEIGPEQFYHLDPFPLPLQLWEISDWDVGLLSEVENI